MPPVQKAGVVVASVLMGVFAHSIVSTINRNTIYSQNTPNHVNNNTTSSINKLIDDSSLSFYKHYYFIFKV